MFSVKDLKLNGKSVFLRCDFNVPLDRERNIRDETRIRAALPTLQHLIKNGARTIVSSHLGRPKGKIVPELSMRPVAERLSALLSRKVTFAPGILGDEVRSLRESLGSGDVLLLENLRFHPGEKANDPDFARELAEDIDIYVNDAFGTCHRAHASVVGVPSLVKERAAGYLINKELEYLNHIIQSPKKPFTAILGGAKVSDKIQVISKLIQKADSILIGGAMAYTFFAAQGLGIGRSLVEKDMAETALELIRAADQNNTPLHLPLDHVVASSISDPRHVTTVTEFPLPEDMMALDIGPKTRETFSRIISHAATIFWNGPMGVFETEAFSHGTIEIAKAFAESEALTIVGGGDSVAAIHQAGVSHSISHISTGGGASLEYIANESLPGIDSLMEK